MGKKKSTKKFKGTRYIAQKLTKYYKKRYPKYADALPKAREVFKNLKDNGDKVILANIFPLVKSKRKASSKKAPVLEPKLLDLSYYFELVDYPVYISRSPNTVWFTSKLFPSDVEDIEGGTNVDYEQYFRPYVSFINSQKGLTDPEDKRYETQWFITCTPPVYNRAKKRWESKIISTDQNGDEFDYGFKRGTPERKAKKIVSPTIKPKQPTKTPDTPIDVGTPKDTPQKPQANAERVKEIRGLIADLREDAKAGLISKEDYASMVKDLTSKLDKGGSV